jgi:hypothetical protein
VGEHLGVQRNVDIGDRKIINIPPDRTCITTWDLGTRCAILELQACAWGGTARTATRRCLDVVSTVEMVNSRIDNNDAACDVDRPRSADQAIGHRRTRC